MSNIVSSLRAFFTTSLGAGLVACGSAAPSLDGGTAGQCPVAPNASFSAGSAIAKQTDAWSDIPGLLSIAPEVLCRYSREVCGEERDASFTESADGEAVILKSEDRYLVFDGLWDTTDSAVQRRITRLGDLIHVAIETDILGRQPMCEDASGELVPVDDPTSDDCTSATVVMDSIYHDFIVDPATGRVVWQASCSLGEELARHGGDDEGHSTRVTREGSAFSYTTCVGKSAPTRFTLGALAACPSTPR